MHSAPQPRRPLTTWQEIAAYLDVAPRTAQNWEREFSLPVHRHKSEKSRVWAYPDELDAWRNAQSPLPKPHSVFPWKRWAAAGALLLAVAGLALWWATRPGPPVRYETSGSLLLTFDARNREVWRYALPGAPAPPDKVARYENAAAADPGSFGDFDADGRVELRFAFFSHSWGNRTGKLLLFDQRGKLRWTYSPATELRTSAGASIAPSWILSWVASLRAPRPDGGRLVVVSHHVYSWPSRVSILTPAGHLVADYWFPGWLVNGLLSDIDGDGREEILLAGIANASPAPFEAALLVLDSGFSTGQSPLAAGGHYQLAGPPLSPEAALILFPRNPYPGPPGSTWLLRGIRVAGPRIEILEQAVVGRNPALAYIHFVLDRRLSFLSLSYDKTFEPSYAAGLPPSPDRTRQVTEALSRLLTVRNRFAAVPAERRSPPH